MNQAATGRGTRDSGLGWQLATGNWQRIPAGMLQQLTDESAVHVDLAGHSVCLVRSRGLVHALLDECSYGQVALSDGTSRTVLSNVAAWFLLHSAGGMPTGPPASKPVPVYPVRVTKEGVEVALPGGPEGGPHR